MEYLVVDAAAEVRKSLCYLLLSLGIRGIPASSRDEALEILKSDRKIDTAIIDLDSVDVDGVRLVDELKKSESTRHLNIIAHSIKSNRELVDRMMESGVIGYLLKPYRENEAAGKLKKILDRRKNHNAKRKHIRVRPDPEELLRLHFKLPGLSALISGRIIDISMGGTAVELFNPPSAGTLPEGQAIPNINFTLNRKSFSPPGKVVLFKEQLLALRFDYLTSEEKAALGKYIFRRLTA